MPVFDLGQVLSFCGRIALQLVHHNHPGHVGPVAEQLPEGTPGRIGITVLLNQDVRNHAILINRSPEIMGLAPDPDEDLIQVPFISRLRPKAVDGRGRVLAEANAPFTDAFVTGGHALTRQDPLDIPQAEAEVIIESDRVGDDLRRKAEASVGILVSAHRTKLSPDQPGRPADNTSPSVVLAHQRIRPVAGAGPHPGKRRYDHTTAERQSTSPARREQLGLGMNSWKGRRLRPPARVR